MAMTRRHFEKIAQTLKERDAPEDMILQFCDWLVEENPRFNTHKFCVASGYWDSGPHSDLMRESAGLK